MKKLIQTILFLLLSFSRLAAGQKELIKEYSYPKNDQDYFFKPISSLAVFDNLVYAVENLSNKVVALRLDFPQIKYLFDIGKPGQGPGDLMYPISISIWGDDIAIKEASAFSFFSRDGRFRSKFKVFSNNKSFFFQDDKIYWLNPSIKQDYLVEVYLKNGKRISTIGSKSIIPQVVTNDPSRVDSIYEGIIVFYDKSIFYLNSRFGNFCRYSLDGNILVEGDMSDVFGNRGRAIKEFNTAVYINNERRKAGDVGYPKPLLFEASTIHNNDLFFLGSRYDPKGDGRTYLDLKRYSLDSMVGKDDYVIEKKGFCRIDSFIILDHKGTLFMLLSITDFGEGHFLEIYELRQ